MKPIPEPRSPPAEDNARPEHESNKETARKSGERPGEGAESVARQPAEEHEVRLGVS